MTTAAADSQPPTKESLRVPTDASDGSHFSHAILLLLDLSRALYFRWGKLFTSRGDLDHKCLRATSVVRAHMLELNTLLFKKLMHTAVP